MDLRRTDRRSVRRCDPTSVHLAAPRLQILQNSQFKDAQGRAVLQASLRRMDQDRAILIAAAVLYRKSDDGVESPIQPSADRIRVG